MVQGKLRTTGDTCTPKKFNSLSTTDITPEYRKIKEFYSDTNFNLNFQVRS